MGNVKEAAACLDGGSSGLVEGERSGFEADVAELEAGLRIGSEILDLFRVKQEEIDLFVKRLRRQHLL